MMSAVMLVVYVAVMTFSIIGVDVYIKLQPKVKGDDYAWLRLLACLWPVGIILSVAVGMYKITDKTLEAITDKIASKIRTRQAVKEIESNSHYRMSAIQPPSLQEQPIETVLFGAEQAPERLANGDILFEGQSYRYGPAPLRAPSPTPETYKPSYPIPKPPRMSPPATKFKA